jgi:hypothetical protein
LIILFPAIATTFPEQLRAEGRAVKVEPIDDSMHRLEEDPHKAMREDAGGK